jgi:hypothetical protein
MTVLIMQEHEATTPKDFACATNQASRDQLLRKNGLVVSIHIPILRLLLTPLPELLRPSSQGPGKSLSSLPGSKHREKPFEGPVPIGSLAQAEQTKSITAVAAQITRATQPVGSQQQQG